MTVAAFCERSYGEALDKLLAGVHLRAFETAMQELSLSSGDELAGRLDFLENGKRRSCVDGPVFDARKVVW